MPPSETGEQRTRTAEAILAAAEPMFLEHGYSDVRIDGVAQSADVSVGSVYVHFGSKHGLYAAVLERAFDLLEEHLANAFTRDRSEAEQVLAAGQIYLRFYFDHPGHFRLLLLPALGIPPDDAQVAGVLDRLSVRAETLVDRLAAAIRRAVDAGDFDCDDPPAAARFLTGAWNGVMAMNLRPDRLRLDDEGLSRVLAEGQRIVTLGLATAELRGDLPAGLGTAAAPRGEI